MALQYPKKDRLFVDMVNSNQRLYRESEIHARIEHDMQGMREDLGFEKQIYEELHDPD